MWTTLSAAAALHPDLAAAHQRGLQLFTAVVAGIIDTGRERDEVPQTVSSTATATATAAVLVAVVDGLTLHGIWSRRLTSQACWPTPWMPCSHDAEAPLLLASC